ncbi:MAG: AAA family ATPase [Desulfovibrio sp.]|nr:AAA family ATPase [Desulfovibrio sp.]
MKILRGRDILTWAAIAGGLQERDIAPSVMRFLHEPPEDRVGVLFGLRRTGKTTILRHAALHLSAGELERTAVLFVEDEDSAVWAEKAFEALKNEHVLHVFVDEFTKLRGYRTIAQTLSDMYAGVGMKILLSGTHSLGFRQLEREEWFDRARRFPTTHIPFAEWNRLVPEASMESYMRHGGILSPMQGRKGRGFTASNMIATYVDTAVCDNILHALQAEDRQYRYPLLREMLRRGKLEAAIRNVVLDEAHRIFPVAFMQEESLPSEGEQFCNAILDAVEIQAGAKISPLDRRELKAKAAKAVGFSLLEGLADEAMQDEVRGFLEDMDLLSPLRFKILYPPFRANEAVTSARHAAKLEQRAAMRLESLEEAYSGYHLMPQPGLRISIIIQILNALAEDNRILSMFSAMDEATKYFDKVMSSIYGHMLEEIVMCDIGKVAERTGRETFKVFFKNGEYDMVVRDTETKECGIYEIKHEQCINVDACAVHLLDAEQAALFEAAGNRIASRTVLYRGSREMEAGGVQCRNVEHFLKEATYGSLDPVTGR